MVTAVIILLVAANLAKAIIIGYAIYMVIKFIKWLFGRE